MPPNISRPSRKTVPWPRFFHQPQLIARRGYLPPVPTVADLRRRNCATPISGQRPGSNAKAQRREGRRWEGKAEILKVENRNGEHRTSNIEHRMKGGFTLQEQTEIAESTKNFQPRINTDGHGFFIRELREHLTQRRKEARMQRLFNR